MQDTCALQPVVPASGRVGPSSSQLIQTILGWGAAEARRALAELQHSREGTVKEEGEEQGAFL